MKEINTILETSSFRKHCLFNQLLSRIIGVKKGETYNGVLLQKRIADQSKPDGEDITNLYQNNGYLFSNINAVEVKKQRYD
jgi:outer membrane protein insertion porin family